MKRIASCGTAFALLVAPHATNGQRVRERALYAQPPEYPKEAKARHLTGTGVFVLHIRPDGTVARVDTAQSIGHAVLDQAAIAAFRNWRFRRHSNPWQLSIPITYTDKGIQVDKRARYSPGVTDAASAL
jgi:TonB family protein